MTTHVVIEDALLKGEEWVLEYSVTQCVIAAQDVHQVIPYQAAVMRNAHGLDGDNFPTFAVSNCIAAWRIYSGTTETML